MLSNKFKYASILILLFINPSTFADTSPSRLTAHSDLVTYLPGLGTPKSDQYSGYVNIKTPDTKAQQAIYYYLATSPANTGNTPVILWLNGGPGSSSFYGLLTENGPYRIQKNLTLKENPFSWSNKYNFLIFDQPIGVGYSFPNKDYQIKNEAQTTDELYLAILAFYKKFPDLHNRNLFIAGESYAGKYIPEIATKILQQNKISQNKIPLTGIILNDAWVNPLLQQAQDAEYAYTHGLIDYHGKKIIDTYYQQCAWAIRTHQKRHANTLCEQMGNYIRNQSGIDLHNIHNIIPDSSNNTYTIEYNALTKYLNQKTVKQALHVDKAESFNLYSSFVGNALEPGEQDSSAHLIPPLLDQNIKILVLSGLNDATDCNFMGTNSWLHALNWQKFNQAKQKQVIHHRGKIIGYITSYRNLSYIKVFNAGHMLMEDQPENSLEIIENFIDK